MIGEGRKGLLRRHIKFAQGNNNESMIHRELIDAKVDEVKYDMIDNYYERNKITSAGQKLG